MIVLFQGLAIAAVLTLSNPPQSHAANLGSARLHLVALTSVLAQYDREIAALRATETAPGLTDPSLAVDRDARPLARDAGRAERSVLAMVATRSREYQQREDRVLSAMVSSNGLTGRDGPLGEMDDAYRAQSARLRGGAQRDMRSYGNDLAGESSAALSAFDAAMAARVQSGLAARAQELREKESTLAFDLERRDAGKRLLLELKLQDLHLDRSTRASLRATLARLNSREGAAVAAMKRADDATLDAYRGRLEADAAAAQSQMAAETRVKVSSNLAMRRKVLTAQSAATFHPIAAAGGATGLSATAAALRTGYRFPADAASIADGFSAAHDVLARRFAEVQTTDRSSRASTDREIERLEADRDALYHAILALERSH